MGPFDRFNDRARRVDTRGFQLVANAAAPGVTPHMHWHVIGPGLPPLPRSTGVTT